MEKQSALYPYYNPDRALKSAREAASRKSSEGIEVISQEDGLITVDMPTQRPQYDYHSSTIDGSSIQSPTSSSLPFSSIPQERAWLPSGVPKPPDPPAKKTWRQRRWWFALAVVALIMTAIITMAVVFTRSTRYTPSPTPSNTPTSVTGSTGSSSPGPTLAISVPDSDAYNIGASYKATFTYYGSGDLAGSPNCNTVNNACGFYSNPGYTAGISQALFGAAPSDGQGPGCGTCWRLEPLTDSSGNGLKNASKLVVVMANNICPALGNPLCGQRNLGLTNQYGANINVNLCMDSGASDALFGTSGVGLAVGNATRVDCSEWKGQRVQ